MSSKEDDITFTFPLGSATFKWPNIKVSKIDIFEGEKQLEEFKVKIFNDWGFTFRLPKKVEPVSR